MYIRDPDRVCDLKRRRLSKRKREAGRVSISLSLSEVLTPHHVYNVFRSERMLLNSAIDHRIRVASTACLVPRTYLMRPSPSQLEHQFSLPQHGADSSL